jgi:hypothetical protein
MISPHQGPYIKELSNEINCSITLVVQEEIIQDRQNSGWTVPNMGRVKIIVKPTRDNIKQLI